MSNYYTAKSIYRHLEIGNEGGEVSSLYEERMVIIESDSFDNAVMEAEREALAYADQFDNVDFGGYIDVFELSINDISPGSEFYSLIRRSNLNIDDYIDRFYDTGEECEREVIDRTNT